MNKEKKHLNDLPEGLKAINKIKIKNIKTGVGHDLMGYYCDFYIGNKTGEEDWFANESVFEKIATTWKERFGGVK